MTGPTCPEGLVYLWDWFQVLNGSRRAGLAGPEPISLLEIDAANRLLAWQLRRDELDALRELDLVWLHPDLGEEADG